MNVGWRNELLWAHRPVLTSYGQPHCHSSPILSPPSPVICEHTYIDIYFDIYLSVFL